MTEAELSDDTYTDETGNVWHRPTAWAYYSVCKAYNALRAPTVDEVAWLIERPQTPDRYPDWWHPEHGWTRDPNRGLRFARQEDAEAYINSERFTRDVVATEHIWTGPRTPDIARGEGTAWLTAKALHAQARVAAGDIDLRDVGSALGAGFDQDFPAALLALAAAPNRAGGGE